MGFRFRKSVNFGPFRVNFSKSGVGWSVGGKGYRYTKTANGRTRKTYSLPGTGLSYVQETSGKKKSSPRTNPSRSKNSAGTQPVRNTYSQSAYTQSNDNTYRSHNAGYSQGSINYSRTNVNQNQPKPAYNTTTNYTKGNAKNAGLKFPQWPVKENSIFDKIAKWIDKTFFGSQYNLTTEKLMIVALCTNVLGIYRIYAGRKIAAVTSWIFLLFSFITRDWMFLFTLPWFVIDLIRIYLGNYGRLKSNQRLKFNAFKALITNKSRSKSKTISGGISAIIIVLICAFCPSAETVPMDPNTSVPSAAVISKSDQEFNVTDTTNAESTIATTTTTTTIVTTTTTTKKTTTTSKKTTTSSNKRTIILNTDTKCYHLSSTCRAAKKIKVANKKIVESTIANVKSQGYSACGICAK